jgi:predicted TIM-barrel fold metal-dependent hydrolase
VGLREAGARGLSFDLQLIPELLEKTAKVLKQAPETPVALCHAGSPYDRSEAGLASWAETLAHLSGLPQVVCKLSGLGMFEHDWTAKTIQPIMAEVIRQFGANRVMFGSNFPVDKLYSDYAKLIQAYQTGLNAADHVAVFETTARAFYEL